MNGEQTGSILIHVVDGARTPLAKDVKWTCRVHDGRPPDEWEMGTFEGAGASLLVKDLEWFDCPFDNYTVIVNAGGYESACWMPVRLLQGRPAPVSLMLIQKGANPNFAGAGWNALNNLRPRFAEILSAGADDAADRYGNLIEEHEGLRAACLLNLLTAMAAITLPSKKSLLDYYWQPIWDNPLFPMAQDRFFAYVDKALIDDVVIAGKMGAFGEEKNPGTWHSGATLSYKQLQFDVANVQLTFHQGNTKRIQGPDGLVDCVVIEPDIDFYKDLLSHGLLEVVPNLCSGNKSDPRMVYILRWMAGQQAGADFNPLYTRIG